MLKDRLEFLGGPGGLRAAAYFGLKLIARLDTFHVVTIQPQRSTSLILPSDWRYLSLYTGEMLSALPGDLVEQLSEQCGPNPEQLLGRGGSLHLLLSGDSLVAQLTIECGPGIQIDAPPLRLEMDEGDGFLSYLYTWPSYRRRSAAQRLIAAAVSDLSTRNVKRIIAHIRATNVPSLAAFRNAGWKTEAMIVCTLSGRLLFAPGAARARLSFGARTCGA